MRFERKQENIEQPSAVASDAMADKTSNAERSREKRVRRRGIKTTKLENLFWRFSFRSLFDAKTTMKMGQISRYDIVHRVVMSVKCNLLRFFTLVVVVDFLGMGQTYAVDTANLSETNSTEAFSTKLNSEISENIAFKSNVFETTIINPTTHSY
jgi:hypothetical protein